MFTEKEVEQACGAFRDVNPDGDSNPSLREVRAIMEETARILAARGGTMTAEKINYTFNALDTGGWSTLRSRLREHIAAQGATVATLQTRVADLEADFTRLQQETLAGVVAGDLYRTTAGRGVADAVAGVFVSATKERMVLVQERDNQTDMVTALQANDRNAMEQLAHALGWKDGGPGWQTAIDAVGALRADLDRVAANRAELVQSVVSAVQERDSALAEVARYEEAARHDQAKYDALRAEVERLKAEVAGAQERSQMLFDAKNHWADRARSAESRLATSTEALDAIRDGRRFRGEYTPEAIAKAALSLEGDAPQGGTDAR